MPDKLTDDVYARGVLAEDFIVYRSLFDTALMERLTPRPAKRGVWASELTEKHINSVAFLRFLQSV